MTSDGHRHILWNNDVGSIPDGVTNFQRTGALVGLDDAVFNWFYGHNVFGLYITTGGIAITYYMVPKLARRPLYSHLLSLIGFWSIALFYTNTGLHHLLQAPIPNWLKVFAIVGSVALIIPVLLVQRQHLHDDARPVGAATRKHPAALYPDGWVFLPDCLVPGFRYNR